MSLTFSFNDVYSIKKPNTEIYQEWKDSFSAGMKKSLRIIVEATHSALINMNMRAYIPSLMKDGASSFVDGKPAKILKHHNTHSDPVGVVREATFFSTVPEDLLDNPDVQILLSSTAKIEDQLDSLNNLAAAGVMAREDWKGLGYIQLVADIMDPETIEQINDGRFDAVSTSFRSPTAYCSVCKQNLAENWCEHVPGKMYEDEEGNNLLAFLVPAVKQEYTECSLVVHDADPFTAIHAYDSATKEDKKEIRYNDSWKESLPESNSTFEFRDFEEDTNMKLSDVEKSVLVLLKEVYQDKEEKELEELATKVAKFKKADGTFADQEDAMLDDKTMVQYLIESFQSEDKEVDSEEVYADMEKELDAMLKEGILSEEELKDAKLSTEKRNKLPDSAFCGPERSFPVPDCAHVTAAKRLIGRYKGPGNKARILACVERKAKSLGCTVPKSDAPEDNSLTKDKNATFVNLSCEDLKLATQDELLALFGRVQIELFSRDIQSVPTGACSKCEENKDKLAASEEEVAKAQEETEKLNSTLAVLRDEMKLYQADYVHQVDALVDANAQCRKLKEEKLAIMGTLGGKYKCVEDAQNDLKTFTDINSAEKVVEDFFDMDKLLKKVNNGMAQVPEEGTVESPAISTDADNHTFPVSLSETGLEAIDTIRFYLEDGREDKAKALFNHMRNVNIFSDEITFEMCSADNDDGAE